MARIPTPQESARHILDTFLEFHCRSGYVLSQSNFFGAFLNAPWQICDIVPGLQYAAEQGWVEILDNNKFKLTESGFSKAGEDDDMNLLSHCNEKVTVEHPNGSRREDVPAQVGKDLIIIPDPSVPLAP